MESNYFLRWIRKFQQPRPNLSKKNKKKCKTSSLIRYYVFKCNFVLTSVNLLKGLILYCWNSFNGFPCVKKWWKNIFFWKLCQKMFGKWKPFHFTRFKRILWNILTWFDLNFAHKLSVQVLSWKSLVKKSNILIPISLQLDVLF